VVPGLFHRPTRSDVEAACAPYVGAEPVLAFVVGKTLNGRLLYVVTERSVHVLRLGSALRGVVPKELLGSWHRGQVETEDGISSIRVGPHRAKVRLSDRRAAAEVARLADTAG
jgi:hypothetical protein